jgi:hypothetical protein
MEDVIVSSSCVFASMARVRVGRPTAADATPENANGAGW